MDLQSGAEWGVRLFMGREPTADDRRLALGCDGPEALRSRLLSTEEVRHWGRFVGRNGVCAERCDLDYEEGVRWAYRLALRREPTEDDVRVHAPHVTSPADLRRVLTSHEFRAASPDAIHLADAHVLRQFAPFCTDAPPAGSYANFIGAMTRTEFLHPDLAWKAGTIEDVPSDENPTLHGIAEWIGSLRSVLEAGERFVAIELGAGWAPWLVATALAARRRGVADISLTGVEGSADHHAWMRTHFTDNGLNPDDHALLHAVVGAEDGEAFFPKLHDPVLDYGANAVFNDDEREAAVVRGALERVECVGLPGLLQRTGRVDLLHMDIQGHERAVLEASMPEMTQYVRRAVIGTHSRLNDAVLFDLFVANGWSLEYEKPTALVQNPDGSLHFPVDGEQVWRNDRV